MANEEHLAQLLQGATTWNQWREANPHIKPDLTGAFLSEVKLQGANLAGVNFANATLDGADLSETNLSGADLSGADLTAADLSWADLSRAYFFGAYLGSVDFSTADLTGTDFGKAIFGRTILGVINLSVVHGLETVIHDDPSTIGIDTLYLSHGNIPEVFLRGAGVPEDLITYVKSLVGRPFEFYSCFISYSGQDQEFAGRLHADLQSHGVRCWFAPHDIQGGRKIYDQIDQAIRFHERLLLILSSYSMNSEWVKTEIAKARQREVRENRQVLFPVRLVSFDAIREWECFDADTGKDSAREIREYFIPDFSNWKDYDAYQQAFQRLLRDLKADI